MRLALYQNPNVKGVAVEPPSIRPKMLFPRNEPEVEEDPESGYNKLLCDFYGKDSIRMKKE